MYSATPFRKDRLQLPGKLVFYYSLRKAVEDRAFGQVAYSAVEIPEGAKARRDNALVQKALEIWHRDRSSNYDHRLLIRTDRVNDGKRLAALYTDAGLRVEAVSSRLSKASIAHIEEKLQKNELDGVVCVDMFGEAYDFPKFKIAVLHVAHRSLVPTLQFIGRFARTNDERPFIAIPSDVDTESGELYREGVDWAVLLADIADARQTFGRKACQQLRVRKG